MSHVRSDLAHCLPTPEASGGPQSAPATADGPTPWTYDLPYGRSGEGRGYYQSSGQYSLPRQPPGPGAVERFECHSSFVEARCGCHRGGNGQGHGYSVCCYTDSASSTADAKDAITSTYRPADSATEQAVVTPDTVPRVPGKRRKRHHDIASKVRSVQPVPRDQDGNYEMPVQVGILVVLNLGKVVWDRDAFHNERYIWPVGYTVQREYYSMIDPRQDVIYTCWVSESKDTPLFHIEAEDAPDAPIVAPTATGAWTAVLRKVNQIRHREHSNSASGPDYFGFSHPTIAKMIQDLPGASRCRSYVMQHFVEMKDRHVRGVVKKGRGGRPSIEMLSRGQRALMASASSSSPSVCVSRVGDGQNPVPDDPDEPRRMSVATLTHADSASKGGSC
ncbi:hypothetical protein H4S01_002965 [Coemansia sp. RSA 2610]|nr:hypothetical protein H4S01_002965 [Coemansia sp. RSA 2610]